MLQQLIIIAPAMSIYRDFAEISCPDYVNLQRFYEVLTMSIDRDSLLWCPDYVNLQRFHGAPTTSIYRDFMAPRLRQFTEILCCPNNVNLQRFYGVPTMSIYRDFSDPNSGKYYKAISKLNMQTFAPGFLDRKF